MPEVIIPYSPSSDRLIGTPGVWLKDGSFRASPHDLPWLGKEFSSLTSHANRYSHYLTSYCKKAYADIDPQQGEFMMWNFQRQGAAFLMGVGGVVGGALLSADMGVGKTLMATAAVKTLALNRTLVVAPAAVKRNWARELKRAGIEGAVIQSGNEFHKTVIKDGEVVFKRVKEEELGEEYGWMSRGQTMSIRYPREYNWLVMNYDILDRLAHGIGSPRAPQVIWHLQLPDAVILDEAHLIKSSEARRTRTALTLLRPIRYKFLLTGTPILNRTEELFPLLNLIDPRRFNSLREFERRYCGKDPHLDELKERLKFLLFRRTKAQVMRDLPAKRRAFIEIPLTPKHQAVYDKAEDDLVGWLLSLGQQERAANATHAEAFARIGYLRKIALAGKIEAEVQFIQHALISGVKKVVVFSTQLDGVFAVRRKFEEECVLYTGEQSETQRDWAIKKFWDDEGVKVFAATLQAGAFGINLQCASVVMFLDLWWVPAVMAQAEDRIHRIGQQNPVLCYYFYTAATIESDIINVLREKVELVGEVVGDKPMELEGKGVKWLLSSMIKRRQAEQ